MLKRMMSNSAIYALGDVTVRLSGLLLIPLYTHYLTPEDYGILSTANTCTAILAVFMMLSLMAAFTRFYFDCDVETEKKNLFSSVFYATVAWSLVLVVIMLLSGEKVLGSIITIAFYPYMQLAILIAYAGVIPQMLLSIFQVEEKAKSYALFTILSFLITASLVIYHVVFLKQGAQGSLEGTLTGLTLTSIAALIFLKKHWLVLKFDISLVQSSLHYSLPLVPHLLLIWVMMGSDILILQHFRPMGEVGIYSLGYTLGFAFFVITGALAKAWSPIFYRHADSKQHQHHLSRVITSMLMLMLLIVTVSMIFLSEAVHAITTQAFYGIAQVIPWVALSAIFHVVYISHVNILFYDKKNGLVAVISACAALFNVLLNIVFIPKYGMQAAAISTALAYLLQMSLVYFFARRLRKLDYRKKDILFVGLFCMLMYTASMFVSFSSLWLLIGLKVLLVLTVLLMLHYFKIFRWKGVVAE